MTVKEFKNILSLYPNDFQVVISDPVWLDKSEDYWAIECKPITAISQNKKCKEVQLFYADNIKEEFPYLQEKIINNDD